VVYTGAAQTVCTATVTGPGGLNQSVPVTYTNNTNAGTANASATYAGNANYSGSTGTGNFAIAKKALTVTANSVTQSHAATWPVFTGVMTGLVAGDGITATYSAGTPTTAPGTYTITPTLVDPNGKLGDYSVTSTNGVLTLTNAAPVANPDSYTGQWNTLMSVAAPGVITNDTDADHDPLTAALVSTTAHGVLTLSGNGSFTYMPAANYSGADAFTYKVTDGFGGTSNTTTVSLTVTTPCPGDGDASKNPDYNRDDCNPGAPLGNNDSYSTQKNHALTVGGRGVLTNDGPTSVSVVLVTNAAHGTVALNANGTFVYTPTTGFQGTDTFTYVAKNAAGVVSNVATVTITVINTAPQATNDSYWTPMNVTLTVAAAGVLSNDTDADGDPLTSALLRGPSHGTVVLAATGSFVYVPTHGFTGNDQFTYTVSDGSATDTGTVTIMVDAPPTATANAYTVNKNATLTTGRPGVLQNDTDPNGGTLTAVLVSGPSHGTLTLNANGSFTYTPAANYTGTDTFTYQAVDSLGLASNVATVTITVNAHWVGDGCDHDQHKNGHRDGDGCAHDLAIRGGGSND
jgi:VCBS repeat-containing protein